MRAGIHANGVVEDCSGNVGFTASRRMSPTRGTIAPELGPALPIMILIFCGPRSVAFAHDLRFRFQTNIVAPVKPLLPQGLPSRISVEQK